MGYAGNHVSVADIRDLTADVAAVTTSLASYQTLANFTMGTTSITPVANTPTSKAITGLSVSGSTFYAMVASETSVPGSTVLESSYTAVTGSGVTLWVYRTNTTTTTIDYMVLGV